MGPMRNTRHGGGEVLSRKSTPGRSQSLNIVPSVPRKRWRAIIYLFIAILRVRVRVRVGQPMEYYLFRSINESHRLVL